MTPIDVFRQYVSNYGEDQCREVYINTLHVPPDQFDGWLNGTVPSMFELMQTNGKALKLLKKASGAGKLGPPVGVLSLAERHALLDKLGNNFGSFLVEHSMSEAVLGKALMGRAIALHSAAYLRTVLK